MPPSNREQILEGTIACIQTRGVAATTTRDIAAAAGASLASIPYHFGSKDALMDEALGRAIRRFAEHLDGQRYDAELPPLQELAAALATTLASFEDVRPLLVSVMEAHVRALHSEDFQPRVAAHRRAAVRRIAERVQALELGDRGGLADEDARALAVLVLAIVDGLMLAWLIDAEHTPDGETIAEALGRAFSPLLAECPAEPA
ncbi:MAG TPA: TetR/AcrR family transcriptional regulator [Solirubrobacteraceae bacterium]|nr:TetR/AcrR family transcriptional regulator [Solirubrobacteraceae bacterium]